jgi:TPR repeat protein
MAFFLFVGKFRHLPVVENGEVIAMLDIAKCLYDAISRLEKAAEQGSALAAVVEGVERQLGGNFSGIHIVVSALASSLLFLFYHQMFTTAQDFTERWNMHILFIYTNFHQ